MEHVILPYLSVLNQINWQESSTLDFPNERIQQWLTEQGSLSRLMKAHCQTLSVEVLQNRWLESAVMTSEESMLLQGPNRFLLRQVILCGDGCPWVIGHTLIPELTAYHQSYDLSKLGESPIGEFVFQMEDVRRDKLQSVRIESEQGGTLWGRRSRLWMEQKPMLVTELFLPESPVYG